jgi:hypothetical protein
MVESIFHCSGLPLGNQSAYESNALYLGVILPIDSILPLCGNAQVALRVIQGVVIYMITLALIPSFQTEDDAMHILRGSSSIWKSYPTVSIETLSIGVPHRAPFEFIQPLEVARTNFGGLPPREGNQEIIRLGCHIRSLSAVRHKPVLVTPTPHFNILPLLFERARCATTQKVQ